MRLGIGFGLERIGLAALAFPKTAALCLLALLIAVGVSLPRVSFDNDIHRVFLSDSALSEAQRAYDRVVEPPLSTVMVHITSNTALTGAQMAALRDLSLDLEFIDGASAVTSPFVLRGLPTDIAPSGRPVFSPAITDAYPQRLAEFEALGTGLPTFLNPSNTAMLISVSVNTDETDVARAVVQVTSELDRALPEGVSAAITGEDVISAQIVSALKDDLLALNIWGALVVTLAALLVLRDLRMALLAVVPAIFGAAGVLALSVWLGYPITVLSNVIPVLLLVIGVADGLHLAGHMKKHGTLRDAVRDTVRDTGPACALTALTTATAFASITLTGNAQLTEFAVLGALGTMLSFAIVITTFALMGRVMAPTKRPIPDASTQAALGLTRIGVARPRSVVIACLLALGVGLAGFMQTKAWFPLYQNLPDGSATLAANDAIAEDFGGVFQMIAETDGDWQQTRAVVEQLEELHGQVLSEVNLARWLGDPDTQPDSVDVDALPQNIATRLRSDTGMSRIFISVPEPMRNDATLAQFDTLRQAALSAGADRVIGLPAIMRAEALRLIEQLSLGLVIAVLGATCLVAIAFRSIRLLPILVVPNILPLILTGASLHLWARGELSPPAVLALTLAFGIAIDDTVHFLNRFAAARASGQSALEAVTSAATSAGQVIVLTTVLLTAGLCVTFLSDFTPIRLFGGLMIVTLWAALVIDLLLLPALLTWKGARHAAT